MFFLIYLITIFIFILLIIDLIRIITPESKLDIKPIKYKINISEIEFIFKILNYSNKKESMVPNLDFNLDYVDNNELVNIEHNKEIIIDDENSLKNFKSYWKTTIIKSNHFINVRVKLKLKEKLIENKTIWMKINWSNYGQFGLVKKQNCFLLNNNNTNQIPSPRKLIKIPINKSYIALAIKTDLLGIFDDPVKTISAYCRDIIKKGDILVIGETPLAIMQGRYINPVNIKYSIYSKILCSFFHPTSSLATACGMQLLINKIGFTRIVLALFLGLLFKIIGIKGIFYMLTSQESSLIDDISGTTFPYDKSIVMGPTKTKDFCKDVSKVLGINVVVADVNDLGKVKILASSNKYSSRLLKSQLMNNPAGNADQKTPIVLIRKI